MNIVHHSEPGALIADPERLLDSATRLYGEDMDRLWGDFLPVPEERLRVLKGGERVIDGQFEVAYFFAEAAASVLLGQIFSESSRSPPRGQEAQFSPMSACRLRPPST